MPMSPSSSHMARCRLVRFAASGRCGEMAFSVGRFGCLMWARYHGSVMVGKFVICWRGCGLRIRHTVCWECLVSVGLGVMTRIARALGVRLGDLAVD